MKNKTKRLLAIRDIIKNKKVSTQEELLQHLSKEGFIYTQATLSRDLRFLKIGRKADGLKGSIYILPDNADDTGFLPLNEAYPINGFVSLAFASNLAVIRTQPGYASAIASTIDKHAPYEIIGTIAGDDTILLIPAENVTRSELKNALIIIFPVLAGNI
jgi:transcriptional regulator of arginine metabolism